jgi:SH3 domain
MHSRQPSRPPSHLFPVFSSNLPYTNVRDFAYPSLHPLHYGPPPEPSGADSGVTTPASEASRRLSDPTRSTWDGQESTWAKGPWSSDGGVHTTTTRLAPMTFQDGPPWSEDEDLQSPVVTTSRHRKSKSSAAAFSGEYEKSTHGNTTSNGAGLKNSEVFGLDDIRSRHSNRAGASNAYDRHLTNEATGPVREGNESRQQYPNNPGQRDSHFATNHLPNLRASRREGLRSDSDEDSSTASSPSRDFHADESRYSRDYHFTIASPDEEMHGKAVALFDFERENENELPLVEGQVVWVSYRHGQGWLVAEDPKTRESGLVPEEYVRLLRDIRGGIGSLNGDIGDGILSPVSAFGDSVSTPTQAEHTHFGHSSHLSNGSTGHQHPAVLSSFSTSSKDLDKYPHHLLGTNPDQIPPQVVHYTSQRGISQTSTPTLPNARDSGTLMGRRGSEDTRFAPDTPPAVSK